MKSAYKRPEVFTTNGIITIANWVWTIQGGKKSLFEKPAGPAHFLWVSTWSKETGLIPEVSSIVDGTLQVDGFLEIFGVPLVSDTQ